MANNFIVKDAGVANVTFKSTDNIGVHTPHHNIEFASVAPAVGSGTTNTGTLRVVVATDQAQIPVIARATSTAVSPVYTEGANNVPLSTNLKGGLRVVIQAPDGTDLDFTSASPTNISQLNGNTVSVGNGVSSNGTLRVAIASDNTPFTVNTKEANSTPVSAFGLSNTANVISASACVVTDYFIANYANNWTYIQMFDITGTITPGVSTPKWSLPIPPNGAANISGLNITFANALKIIATNSVTGANAPTAAVDVNLGIR